MDELTPGGVEALKEQHCFVRARSPGLVKSATMNPKEDWLETVVKTASGRRFKISGNHRMECGELLFGPMARGGVKKVHGQEMFGAGGKEISQELRGLPEMIKRSVDMLPTIGVRSTPEIYGLVGLSGGTALLPGLSTRLRNEFLRQTRQGSVAGVSVKVAGNFDQSTMGVATGSESRAFHGASLIAATAKYDRSKVTQEMFQLRGLQAMHQMGRIDAPVN